MVGIPLAIGAGLRRTRTGDTLAGLAEPVSVGTVAILVWLSPPRPS